MGGGYGTGYGTGYGSGYGSGYSGYGNTGYGGYGGMSGGMYGGGFGSRKLDTRSPEQTDKTTDGNDSLMKFDTQQPTHEWEDTVVTAVIHMVSQVCHQRCLPKSTIRRRLPLR